MEFAVGFGLGLVSGMLIPSLPLLFAWLEKKIEEQKNDK